MTAEYTPPWSILSVRNTDVAVPNAEEPIYHIDRKVQESDPTPKTTLNAGNALAKIRVMRNLKESLGRLVPALILNPMGLRPAVQRANPSHKGLWLRFRIAFLDNEDDGLSESVRWKEVVLEGVIILQQLTTEDVIDHLKNVLATKVANLDRAVLERRMDELEVHLLLKIGETLSLSTPQAKSIAFSTLVTKAESEVRDRVVLTALAEADYSDQTRSRSETQMQETPYWQVGEDCEPAVFCDYLLDDWITFKNWVAGLPEQFVQLKELANTGCATDRTKLGHELVEAWKQHRSPDKDVGLLVIALADAILWRVVKWVRACNYQYQHDPAVLVLIEN